MEQNFQNNHPLEEKQEKSKLLLFSVFIALALLLLSAISFFSKNKIEKQIPTQTEKNLSYPQKNILIYTRCFGEDELFSHCNLYSSSLKEPEEQLVFTFNFPDEKENQYMGYFRLSIDGVSNKRVVYTKSYWEGERENIYRKKRVGFIDLLTGQDNEIFSESLSTGEQSHLQGLFVDTENGRVFYSDFNIQQPDHKIVQYNLENEQKTVIADNYLLDFPHLVIGANKSQVFLSRLQESVFDTPSWSKTLDLTTNSITSIDEPLESPVFDKKAEYVAYVSKEEVAKGLYNISLLVSKTDGTEKKIIRSINKTKLRNIRGNFSDFSNYFFNSSGNTLSYTIYKAPNLDSSTATTSNSYLAIIKPQTEIIPGQRGVKILPKDDAESQSQPIIVEPDNVNYQWVEYQLFSGPLEGNVQEGIIYEAEDGWFINPAYYLEDSKLDLINERSVIAVKAKNLHLIIN